MTKYPPAWAYRGDMGTVLGDLLPLAVGVSISPIPIVAAILMILSKNASAAAGGFATGWTGAIVAATAVFAVLSAAIGLSAESEPGAAAAWIKIVLGLLLLAVALTQWRHRADTDEPGWMRGIDSLTPGEAVLLGAALAAVNPKNLLLCVSARLAPGRSGSGSHRLGGTGTGSPGLRDHRRGAAGGRTVRRGPVTGPLCPRR